MLRLAVCVANDGARPASRRRVNVWHDAGGRAFAEAFSTEAGYEFEWPGLARFEFAPPDAVVTCHVSTDREATLARELFDSTIQPLLVPAYGLQALHASAAATPDGAVVFCGLGGSGKSTLAFALGLERGCRQIADDAVVVEIENGAPVVRVLPFRAKLRPASVSFFASASSSAIHPASEPVAVPVDVVRIGAIVILEQRPEEKNPAGLEPADSTRIPSVPELRLVPAAEAFARLIAHAHVFDPGHYLAQTAFVDGYLAIAAAVPIHSLSYARRFDELPRLVALVKEAARSTAVASA